MQQADCQPLRTCTGKPGEITLNACQNDPPTNSIVLEGAMAGGPNYQQFTLPTPSWQPGQCSCVPAPPALLQRALFLLRLQGVWSSIPATVQVGRGAHPARQPGALRQLEQRAMRVPAQ